MPVVLHDATINRTARNADGSAIAETLNIADIDYATALTYDFSGDWSAYRGTKIPTFEEFIALCRCLQLHPYIEIEEEIFTWQAVILLDIVRKYGMENHVTWISFTHASLLRIVELSPCARVGYNRTEASVDVATELQKIGMLRTGYNEAFANLAYTNPSLADYAAQAFALGIPVEVWCPNSEADILALPEYVTGVTTDKLIAADVIYANAMGDVVATEG
jgi:glycerophosphoryl diester phosphodiesterase